LANLFRFIGLRNLCTKPLRTLLTAVGVALGVALFVAIQIINRSTLNSFQNSIQAIAGKATLDGSRG
jgi:putative ABC transport system permease protein